MVLLKQMEATKGKTEEGKQLSISSSLVISTLFENKNLQNL